MVFTPLKLTYIHSTVCPSLIEGGPWHVTEPNQFLHFHHVALVLEFPSFPATPAHLPWSHPCSCGFQWHTLCGGRERGRRNKRGSQVWITGFVRNASYFPSILSKSWSCWANTKGKPVLNPVLMFWSLVDSLRIALFTSMHSSLFSSASFSPPAGLPQIEGGRTAHKDSHTTAAHSKTPHTFLDHFCGVIFMMVRCHVGRSVSGGVLEDCTQLQVGTALIKNAFV